MPTTYVGIMLVSILLYMLQVKFGLRLKFFNCDWSTIEILLVRLQERLGNKENWQSWAYMSHKINQSVCTVHTVL